MRGQRAGLTLARHAATEREIRFVARHELDQPPKILRIITAIRVDEGDDVLSRRRCERGNAGQAGRAIAAHRLYHDLRAFGARDARGSVAAAVVDDHDAVEARRPQAAQHAGNRGLFVQCRNDYIDRVSHRPFLLAAALGVQLFAFGALVLLGDLRAHVWLFLLCFALAAAALFVARGQLRGPTDSLLFVAAVAIVLRLPMLFTTPSLSDDVWRYLHDGRAQIAGVDPYRLAPADARTLTFRGPEHGRINHPQLVTIYPPAAQALFFLNALAGSHLIVWRLLLIGFELFAMTVLARLGAQPRNLALFAWHPLAVVETAGSGHLDIAAIALLLAGLYYATRGRGVAAGMLTGFGAAVKLVPVLALLATRHGRDRRTVAAMMAVIALAYAAFGPSALGSLPTFARSWEANAGIYAVLAGLTDGYRARILCAALLLAAFFVIRKTQDQPLRAAALLTLTLLLLSPVVHPWYLLWLLAFVPALPPGWLRTTALVWTLVVVLSYVDLSWLEYAAVSVSISAAALGRFQSRTSGPSPEKMPQTDT